MHHHLESQEFRYIFFTQAHSSSLNYNNLTIKIYILQTFFHLQSHACPRYCLSASVYEMKPLFASTVLLWTGNQDECTFFLASQGQLYQQPSTDCIHKKITHYKVLANQKNIVLAKLHWSIIHLFVVNFINEHQCMFFPPPDIITIFWSHKYEIVNLL